MFLSFWTDWSGQTVQTQISQSSLIKVYTVCNSGCILWMHYSKENSSCSAFRMITPNFWGVRNFRICTVMWMSYQHPIKQQITIWAPSNEFVSSSIPSWPILSAHAQPFRGARDLAFCLKVPLDWLLVWASSEGSGETARMRRLAWTFAARIGDKYQIRLTRSI